MDISKLSILDKIEQCLVPIKRQKARARNLKSALYGTFIAALVMVLYIVVSPSFLAQMASLGASSSGEAFAWTHSYLTILAILLPLWLVLSVVLSILSALLFRYRENNAIQMSPKTALTPRNFLLHLNRLHPSLEESAHLLILDDDLATSTQTLQLKRITPALNQIINSDEQSWLPKVPLTDLMRKFLFVLLFGPLLLIAIIALKTAGISSVVGPANVIVKHSAETNTNYLKHIIVLVSPPAYTQQPQFEQSDLNISVLEGSQIEWRLPLEQNVALNERFEISLSDAKTLPFFRNDGGYNARLSAITGAVYTITQSSNPQNYVSDIATVFVQQDIAPIIEFKAPILTITEIGKNNVPSITTVVNIKDDYGIGKVKIVASIAKGSGESVKFRDQEFQFDSVHPHNEQTDSAQTNTASADYSKTWDLNALNMAPGDELYFSVHASDNKTPQAQKTISPIKIIRWLEDEEENVAGEGIVIDFMPEYFKSQRQIIIETQALIEQVQSLSAAEYSGVSRALAIDQSDLKQSYGQYLGDEVDSGIMHNMEAGPAVPGLSEHANEDNDDHSEDSQSEQDHEHESQNDHGEGETDLSGYQAVIGQFGHNHGEANIGFIKTSQGQINPKVLMKSAISAMWQAELHLQLSEPKLALPYEKEALSFLNRAKQAQRIYVKRLGFEPPPVTEERRYAGKLKDILSYQTNTQTLVEADQNSQFTALIVALNQHLTLGEGGFTAAKSLSIEQRELVDLVASKLSSKLADEPEWITQLANLKRIQVANSFNIQNCPNCVQSLIIELSSQLSPPIAQTFKQDQTYTTNHPSVKAYSKTLLRKLTNDESNVKQGSKP